MPPFHDNPCTSPDECAIAYGRLSNSFQEVLEDLEAFIAPGTFIDVFCVDRLRRQLTVIGNSRLLTDDEFTRATAALKRAKALIKRFMPREHKDNSSPVPPLLRLQPVTEPAKKGKVQAEKQLNAIRQGANFHQASSTSSNNFTASGRTRGLAKARSTWASGTVRGRGGINRGNSHPQRPTATADLTAHQPQVEATISISSNGSERSNRISLWAPDLSTHSGEFREALRLPAPRTPAQFARLGYLEGDTFLDTSIQGQRIELEQESQSLSYETSLLLPSASKPKRIALICSLALKRLRLTPANHYHDWTGNIDIGTINVQEEFWGQHWICEQFVVCQDFSDIAALQTLVNRIIFGSGENQYDLVVLVGGFPPLVNPSPGVNRSYLPTATQWCNIIVQSLLTVGRRFTAPVIYGGFDVLIPSSNVGFSIRQAAEQIRMRNRSLWDAHKIYFTDVLSRSESISGTSALYESWRSRRLELLRQLVRSICLRIDSFPG
jgi:hypothetical protein